MKIFDYNTSVPTFREYLELKFLEWQRKMGGRRTVKEFAEYIGVGQTTVSMWWNNEDRKPEGENIFKLARLFGTEVYDVLGLPRPEENLLYIQSNWEQLSARERKAIRDMAEKYVTSNNKKG